MIPLDCVAVVVEPKHPPLATDGKRRKELQKAD
jgi:hypothetical protein